MILNPTIPTGMSDLGFLSNSFRGNANLEARDEKQPGESADDDREDGGSDLDD